MKHLFIVCLLSILLSPVLFGADSTTTPPPGVVILELFTSEGCSSCPPAEKKLQQYTQSARDKGLPVYLIAYHVTVWDKLKHGEHGIWKDPYGNAEYTTLLKDYSAIHPHPIGAIATPSIFANGIQLAGKKINSVVDEALNTPTTASLQVSWQENDTLSYQVTGSENNAKLVVVVRESKLQSQITAGENHDKTLTHDYVARWRTAIPLAEKKTGTVHITMPTGIERAHTDVLVFVQNPTLGVHAATSLPVTIK